MFDASGRAVESLLKDSPREPGEHRVTLDTRRFANGVYFYRLHAGGRTRVRKLVVCR